MFATQRFISEFNPIIFDDLVRIASVNLPWEDLKGTTVLVTGGGGFLAAYLIKSLLAVGRLNKLNIKVICVARSTRSVEFRLSAYLNSPDLSFLQHDISQPLPMDFPRADIFVHSAC